MSFSVGSDEKPYITYKVGADTVTKKLGEEVTGFTTASSWTTSCTVSGNHPFILLYTSGRYAPSRSGSGTVDGSIFSDENAHCVWFAKDVKNGERFSVSSGWVYYAYPRFD